MKAKKPILTYHSGIDNSLDSILTDLLKDGMFIWLFHRISGVSLIVLIGLKVLTSYFLFTKDKKPDWALSLHRQPVLDVLLLVLFTFHSVYGIRTIIMDLGYRGEKKLFWLSNVVAVVISAILVYLYAKLS